MNIVKKKKKAAEDRCQQNSHSGAQAAEQVTYPSGHYPFVEQVYISGITTPQQGSAQKTTQKGGPDLEVEPQGQYSCCQRHAPPGQEHLQPCAGEDESDDV